MRFGSGFRYSRELSLSLSLIDLILLILVYFISLYPYNFSLLSFPSLYVTFYITLYIYFVYFMYETDVVEIAEKAK